ncbi:MAG: radical SAM protein [Deltaproteobacteria bacterium]|nr:radical SAM protein [Deltaproteobacteria bacterium]
MNVPFHKPYILVWETTFKCSMRCRHCGSSCDTSRADELSTAEALDLCDQIAHLETQRTVLSGGETFLRDDWPMIADRLVGNGVQVSVITNGLVISKAVIANLLLLREKHPGKRIALHLSVDGVGESHDFLRGIDGAYAKLCEKMKELRVHEIPFSIVTTIHRRNLHQMPEILDMIRQAGAYAWQMQAINVYGRARENDELTITPDEYYEVVHQIADLKARNPDFRIEPSDCIGYFGPTESLLRPVPWSGCHAGIYCYGIQSNGNVKGCLSLIDDRFVEGNVRKEPLRAIWTKPGAFSYNRDFTPDKLTGHCGACEYGALCRGGCTAMAHSYTGSCFENLYCVTAIEAKRKNRVEEPLKG